MMYDMYIMRRTQIYLEESQHERLSRRARAAGTTKSDVVREAVDAYLAGGEDQETQLLDLRAAVRAAVGSARPRSRRVRAPPSTKPQRRGGRRSGNRSHGRPARPAAGNDQRPALPNGQGTPTPLSRLIPVLRTQRYVWDPLGVRQSDMSD